jgi:hypothetical protein
MDAAVGAARCESTRVAVVAGRARVFSVDGFSRMIRTLMSADRLSSSVAHSAWRQFGHGA